MDFKTFILESDIPPIFPYFYRKFEETGHYPTSLKLLEGIYNNTERTLEKPLQENVYNQAFIRTATGLSLDRFAESNGLSRLDNESDDDLRKRILLIKEISQEGSSIATLKKLIENLGYKVKSWTKAHTDALYTDSTGKNERSYTGQSYLYPESWVNYTFYFYLDPTPSREDIEYLEKYLYKQSKLYNKVYVR